MCAMCALVASAGATGVRSWLQAHRGTWLTPARLRVATVAVFTLALLLATVAFSGSTKPEPRGAGHATRSAQASTER